MTIAKRLIILLAVPLAALVGLGIFTRLQLERIEARSRFVAESRIVAMATLANLSRSFAELRVNLRSHLLATTDAQRAAARRLFADDEQDVNRRLQEYADGLVLGDQDRRRLTEYQILSREWLAGAKQIMSLADQGRSAEALALFNGTIADLGPRLSTVSNEWIASDQEAATAAGQESIAGVERFQRNMLVANTTALVLASLLGVVTLRRIVTPIRALEASVKTIAAGNYQRAVPFVGATDEIGGLARSIEVLKQGAAALDQQRWIKSNISSLTGELQGAASVAEFGDRLLSGLVPLVGGGIAGFYVFDATTRGLQRVSVSGLADASAAASVSGSARGWSASAPTSDGSPRSRIFRPATSASPPAWARRRRSRPRRCRRCPSTACSASSNWRLSAPSTRRSSRCSTNCCRWWP